VTIGQLKSYRFSTASQWNSCLFVQADRDLLRARGEVRPFLPYSRPPTLYASARARVPVLTRTAGILWCDRAGYLHRIAFGDTDQTVMRAPDAFRGTGRIVATSAGLWAISGGTAVQLYDAETLTIITETEVPERVVDIAAGSHGSVFALAERQGRWQIQRVSCAGRELETVVLNGITEPVAFAFLRESKRFIVLTGGKHPRLHVFEHKGGDALFTRLVAAVQPCFRATALGSDSRARVFLGGAADGRGAVLALDRDGELLADVPLEPADLDVSGIAANREVLLVAGARGLLRFSSSGVVSDDAGEARCLFVTPMLHSPLREGATPWLRIDAVATLPSGTSLQISYAATDNAEVRDQVKRVVDDNSLPASQRVRVLSEDPDLKRSRVVYRGAGEEAGTFSAPLHGLSESFLWVMLELSAASGAELPSVSELSVIYPGHSLMDNLPAIYRRASTPPDDFLRGIVGVLEATTQGMDRRIASMGSHVDPSTASGEWLDFIARWLGLPWDDALAEGQKRRLLSNASGIAKGRGTRAGLELMLTSLFPGDPPRFRVTDATADFGFAVVGGGSCQGSTLPAMIGGFGPWRTELDSSAVLGYMRLPCPGQSDDGTSRFVGKIRIEVAATAEERLASEPWLGRLIQEIVPLTVRVELRWVSEAALRGGRIDGALVLSARPQTVLGSSAVVGLAQLPDVPIRLPGHGQPVRIRLR
jgi:phage tail-like protein